MTSDLHRRVEELDWEQTDSDTQYLTHSIHRYSGKFIPQIAGQAIDLISSAGDLVLDPYCGSGTTLLEAGLRDRRSIGIDLKPLALLIAEVKTRPVSPAELDLFLTRIREDVAELFDETPRLALGVDRRCLEIAAHADERWSDPWLMKWFADERRYELLVLDLLVRREADRRLRAIGQVAISDVLRRCSFANNSYPNVMFDKRKRTPGSGVPHFLRRLSQICEAVAELAGKLPIDAAVSVAKASACRLPLADSTVDAIVTHPPYIGSVPYAEYGSLSIRWLGYEPGQLDRQLSGGRRRSRHVVARFEEDLAQTIAEMHRVLKPGRYAFMLLGSPIVFGERVDLPSMARSLAASAGLKLAAEHSRTGINRRANLMTSEELLFFVKS